jgi:predicted RNase H-like nuclease (RuvC/YqgF family)
MKVRSTQEGCFVYDNESPAGAWQREWDMRAHTVTEYQTEISELRERIKAYLQKIEKLEITVEKMSCEIIALERQANQWGRSDGS